MLDPLAGDADRLHGADPGGRVVLDPEADVLSLLGVIERPPERRLLRFALVRLFSLAGSKTETTSQPFPKSTSTV